MLGSVVVVWGCRHVFMCLWACLHMWMVTVGFLSQLLPTLFSEVGLAGQWSPKHLSVSISIRSLTDEIADTHCHARFFRWVLGSSEFRSGGLLSKRSVGWSYVCNPKSWLSLLYLILPHPWTISGIELIWESKKWRQDIKKSWPGVEWALRWRKCSTVKLSLFIIYRWTRRSGYYIQLSKEVRLYITKSRREI